MDFKVKIKCQKCLCSFELRSKETTAKNLSCPNCGCTVKEKTSNHLLTGLKELSEVEDYSNYSLLPGDNDSGFSFEIVLPDNSAGCFI